ncbi:MAG: PulJ/GspJ family protein [Armatimonadota bacterium]
MCTGRLHTGSPNLVAPRRRGGQTLVIAVMVMFILAAIGAVFVAMVARNLLRSQRYSEMDVVAQLAEAGIRYADIMLTRSEEGADWRPKPDNDGVQTNPDGTVKLGSDSKPLPAPNWQEMRDQYPDFQWTRAYWPEELGYAGPTGGFSTFNMGEGRFLLRVSYNPDPADPFSKYIKIESIGRYGVFDKDDPTTYRGYGYTQLRREITAYKPIGITDYLRFVTNKDNRPMEFALGCPGYALSLGRLDPDQTAHKNWFRGGPVRVNGDLTWYADPAVKIFLRGVTSSTGELIPLERIEVAGETRLADQTTSVLLTRMKPDGSPVDSDPVLLRPSDDTDFTTAGGFFRDGSDLTDVNKAPRGIRRIDPPRIDALELTRSVNRYQVLTLYSGERVRALVGGRWRWINLGEYGWGRGIYIGNTTDKQEESETLVGGYTMRADWLKPNNPMSIYWKGPYYVPPGVVITLHPDDTDGDGQPDLTITRTDAPGGRKYVWRDAWGNERPEWGSTVTMPYPDPNNGRIIYDRDQFGNIIWTRKKELDGNGVIYAEGNIRIRGMLPPGMQLTVVSNRTIYIEGNLLKYRDPRKPRDPSPNVLDPWRGADNTCALALLARENICINTTQFFSPLNSISPESVGSDARDGSPPFHVIINPGPNNQMRCVFEFGPWESETSNTPPSRWALYLRHSGEFGPTYINAWLNPSSAVTDFGLLYLNLSTTPDLPKHVWGVGDPRFNPPGWGIDSSFVCDVFGLDPAYNAHLRTEPGIMNLLQIALDETTYTRNNYLLGGLAVQPMDIRIEAILYAQEGSFYVIPGQWFNPNPEDTREAFLRTGVRPGGVKAAFPFYGEPLDIRIIIDGAVSENVTAPVSDVEEWMSRWGNIPSTYGSSQIPTAHPGEGLTILYDDHLGWPLADLRTASPPRMPIRRDKYGRALPAAPRLPVCESLLYVGDVM